MAIDENRRVRLRRRLQELLGTEEGSDLMELLPSVSRDQIATKADIEALAVRIANELRAEFRGELNAQTRTLITVLSSMFLSVAGLAFAIARLT